MTNFFLRIKPEKAFQYFFLYPLVVMIVLSTGAIFLDIQLLLFVAVGILIIQFYFGIIWRIIIGRLIYSLADNKVEIKRKYHLFLIISIINLIIMPLIIVSLSGFVNFPIFMIVLVLLLGIYGFISNIFQCKFIAKNLLVINERNPNYKYENAIFWTHIAYLPITAYRVQKEINKLMYNKSSR